MKSYKQPDFQDRIDSAAKARDAALEKLRTKPPIDPEVTAARAAARLAREAAQREKTRLAREAAEEAKAKKIADALEKAAAEEAAKKPELTEEERKAARDARYQARKNRKK